jgi:hypothetical protein
MGGQATPCGTFFVSSMRFSSANSWVLWLYGSRRPPSFADRVSNLWCQYYAGAFANLSLQVANLGYPSDFQVPRTVEGQETRRRSYTTNYICPTLPATLIAKNLLTAGMPAELPADTDSILRPYKFKIFASDLSVIHRDQKELLRNSKYWCWIHNKAQKPYECQ